MACAPIEDQNPIPKSRDPKIRGSQRVAGSASFFLDSTRWNGISISHTFADAGGSPFHWVTTRDLLDFPAGCNRTLEIDEASHIKPLSWLMIIDTAKC